MAYDNSIAVTNGNPYSYTTGGSNRILIVGIYLRGTDPVCTGATYNGTAMTLVGGYQDSAKSEYMFELINPASGANNVAYTTTGAVVFAGSTALSLKGMNQVTFDNAASASGSAIDFITTNLTSIQLPASAEVVNFVGILGGNAATGVQNGATLKQSDFGGTAPCGISYKVETSPTTISSGWDDNDGFNSYFFAQTVAMYVPLSVKVTSLGITFTGKTVNLIASRILAVTKLAMTLTTYSVLLRRVTRIINSAIHTGSLSNSTKNSATLTNQVSNSSTITNSPLD